VDDDDVHLLDQAMDRLLHLRVSDVHGQRLLPAVQAGVRLRLQRDELRVQAPGLAAGRFHLDHVGAEVGEELATHRPRDDLRELEDFDAVEWSRSHGEPSIAREGEVWDSGGCYESPAVRPTAAPPAVLPVAAA